MPELNELYSDFAHRDDLIYIAHSLSSSTRINKILLEKDFDFRVFPDAGEHAERLGIAAYPTNLVIDRSGIIRFVNIGFSSTTVQSMRDKIEKLFGP